MAVYQSTIIYGKRPVFSLWQEFSLPVFNTHYYTNSQCKRSLSRLIFVLFQMKQFLRTTFATPYDANFYSGDWMLGPNYFCWQPICSLGYDLARYSQWVRPKNLDDLEHILNVLYEHGEAVKQYQ